MEYTQLGRTGIRVSRLCLGAWQATGYTSSDSDRFVRTVRTAIDHGINFIDTAEGYGNGKSEELVAQGLEGVPRDQVVLATKFWYENSEPPKLRAALERSLKALRTDYVDLYQHHWPPRTPPLQETLDELLKLQQEGKIRAIGVSNYMEPEFLELTNLGAVEVLQPCYSLLWRSVEFNVLPLCRRLGIAVIPYSPLCQGLLTGRFRKVEDIPNDFRARNIRAIAGGLEGTLKVVDALAEVARKYHRTIPQVALRWLLDQDGITAPIVGASRPEQIEQNLGALGWSLEPQDWLHLAAVSWPLSKDIKPHDSLWHWHSRED